MRRRRWGLRLLEDPAWMRATRIRPGSRSRCRGAALPGRRPATRCPCLRVLAHSWRKQLIHDGKRLVLVSHWPGCCWLALAGRRHGLPLRHAPAPRPARYRTLAPSWTHCRNRGHACGNGPLRPTPAALLELHTLQALDATLAGASLREVAEGLFGADAVAPTGTATAPCVPACGGWCAAAMR
jgi:hypothetical protein